MKVKLKDPGTKAGIANVTSALTSNPSLADDTSFKRSKASREDWLTQAATIYAKEINDRLGERVQPFRVSCGYTGRGGTRRLGACWDKDASADGHHEIFITPGLDKSADVLGVLLHQLLHATVGVDVKHGFAFIDLARKLDLQGRGENAIVCGDDLLEFNRTSILATLGAYPHAKLEEEKSGVPKQSTRLIKCTCPISGYVVRTTREWIDRYGPPISPANQKPMVPDAAALKQLAATATKGGDDE